MNSIPKAAEPLIHEFTDALTQPTYRRFVVLLFAAILGPGKTDRPFSDAITGVRLRLGVLNPPEVLRTG